MKREELLEEFKKLDQRTREKLIRELPKNAPDVLIRRRIREYLKKELRTVQKKNLEWATAAIEASFVEGVNQFLKVLPKELRKQAERLGITSGRGKLFATAKSEALKEYDKKVGEIFGEAVKATDDQAKQLLKIKKAVEDFVDTADPAKAQRLERALKAYGMTAKRARGMRQDRDFEKIIRGIMRDKDGLYMFKDKGGRRWTYRRWSQMQTRAFRNESERLAMVESMAEIGEDIGYVIPHSDPSESCQRMEGMIISVGGATEGLYTLDEMRSNPQEHWWKPTCRHIWRPLRPSEKREFEAGGLKRTPS